MDYQAFPELKIEIRRQWRGGLGIELSLRQPGGVEDDLAGDLDLTEDDLANLKKLATAGKQTEYGQLLYSLLTKDKSISEKFAQVRGLGAVRVRLEIDQDSAMLNGLLWETLTDPDDPDERLLSGSRLLFSRYVQSRTIRQFRLASRDDIRALVVIADPNPSKEIVLSKIVSDELKRAAEALGEISRDSLPRKTDDRILRATLDNIVEQLRLRPADILYLVCHGFVGAAGPVVYLEDDDGNVVPTKAKVVARRLSELPRPPGLVVLASCESATSTLLKAGKDFPVDPDANVAIGPMLIARAGIPAVVAMQGRVTQDTAGAFFRKFFEEMHKHGQIDLAAAWARSEVHDARDWWMPALFMRLTEGRLWYAPGFMRADSDDVWPTLRTAITKRRCTVIIGPRLLDPLIGSTQDLAQSWIDELKTEVPEAVRRDSVLTAQFLSVMHDEDTVRDALRRSVRKSILDRFKDDLPQRLVAVKRFDAEDPKHLWELMAAAGELAWKQDENNIHRVLAGLPFDYYLQASPDPLMEHALICRGHPPRTDIFNWSPADESDLEDTPTSDVQPSANGRHNDAPHLVYLLGSLSQPGSFALTENNYFDFLADFATSRARTRTNTDRDARTADTNRNVLDTSVRRAIATHSLVFLGFELESWAFRVLLRAIALRRQEERRMRISGPSGRQDGAYVGPVSFAVQVAPDERFSRNKDTREEYLQRYFKNIGISDDVRVYWGSASDFIRDLRAKWIGDFGYEDDDPAAWVTAEKGSR